MNLVRLGRPSGEFLTRPVYAKSCPYCAQASQFQTRIEVFDERGRRFDN
jgi:hypothetical protein